MNTVEVSSGSATRAQVLPDQGPAKDPTPEATIHAIFARQAATSPDSIAIVDGETRLSYQDLAVRSDRLAARLAEAGAAPGLVVGFCLDRSGDALIACLAILKTGASYLPLDPAYPAERLDFMLDDAGAVLVLVSGASGARLPERDLADKGVARLDIADEPSAGASPAAILPGAAPAYILYTSGSTGVPKGVVVSHRAVLTRMVAPDFCAVRAAEAILHMAPLTFDAATFEIWAALLNGASIVVAQKDLAFSPDLLRDLLVRERVSHMFVTTALFNRLVAADPGLFASLETVLFGGEKVNAASVHAVLAAQPPRRLVHVYGPTEAVTFSTAQPLAVLERVDAVPIGRPIAETATYTLDSALARSAEGELYIAGAGLATGYCGRPRLTAERFLPDPFGPPGTRMYRSGDWVTADEDGMITFGGRRDHQVKLNGHRIELEEVEAALRLIDGVADAAATTHAFDGDNRLLAFVVPSDGEGLNLSDVRSRLRRLLPDWAVPHIFAVLTALPLSRSGKLDRAALPVLGGVRDLDTPYVAPRTPLETALARIWAQALGVADVGVHDNFFDLGGHSLTVMRVIAGVRAELELDLPLRTMFEHPTVEMFSDAVAAAVAAP